MITTWKLEFDHEPTLEEIYASIEEKYPSPGYGQSSHSQPIKIDNRWIVVVNSNSSCD